MLLAYRRALPLLRIPFSVYLMPVYWFGLSALPRAVDGTRALGVFVVLHLLAYPASNGYNSYYDRDEGSIGGLKQPPKVSEELIHLVWLFDALAVLGGWLLSPLFAALVAVYLLVSKAYSYEGVRLKKYPFLSTFVVVVFQGAFTFLMTQVGVGIDSAAILAPTNLLLALVSTLFLCGSYPLTQVYQHQEDRQRGDLTLSLWLGLRGTFVFAAVGLLSGALLLGFTYWQRDELRNLLIFLVATGPVVVLFGRWAWAVWHSPAAADFEHTMRMNQVSSLCLSAAFVLMFFWALLAGPTTPVAVLSSTLPAGLRIWADKT
ncbi:UbiA family prenyltransferase [Hymenobacter cellulosilyticus]|uniref:UbiA family prenyltransferase n=1 Tax=Hymenobacter cellulosilyticus TaxID=2932248 RepID=A0A8T9Q8R1_9BACT|nr:UbiA family prenyltransferase [Hymenobacter cellulosilyticus]UOQ72190.1 UbiA family prenyltransferase [Hymenobacter cellulosilyticus]